MEKIKGQWQYFLADCWDEFQNKFPGVVDYNTFRSSLQRSLKLFRETGSLTRKEGSGRPKSVPTHKLVQIPQQIMNFSPKTPVRVPAQETSHTVLKKDLHLFPYRITTVQKLLEFD